MVPKLLLKLQLRLCRLHMFWHLSVACDARYLRMLPKLLLKLLIIVQRHPLSVPHHGQLLASSRLPDSQTHLVRGRDHIFVVEAPRHCSQPLHSFRVVNLPAPAAVGGPDPNSLVITATDQLSSCGAVVEVDHCARVVHLYIDRPVQLAHVKGIQVVVLAGHSEHHCFHWVPGDCIGLQVHHHSSWGPTSRVSYKMMLRSLAAAPRRWHSTGENLTWWTESTPHWKVRVGTLRPRVHRCVASPQVANCCDLDAWLKPETMCLLTMVSTGTSFHLAASHSLMVLSSAQVRMCEPPGT